MRDDLFEYCLRLGDDALVLGQKLSRWCGKAPCLEVDLGLSSLALDLVGQGSYWLELAARIEDADRDADALAFGRAPAEMRTCLLVEQDNGDFAQTLARQFLFSNWQHLVLEALSGSTDRAIAETAARSAHDVAYHVQFCREWIIRLGDRACLSHQRVVKSLDAMACFVDDMFAMDTTDQRLLSHGIAIDMAALRPEFDARVGTVLSEAGLAAPRALRTVIAARKAHMEDMPLLTEMSFNTRDSDVRWGF